MVLRSGRDQELPIFEGSGHVDIRSSTAIDFTMFASPTAGGDAFQRLLRSSENPYTVFDQFRLIATDIDGTEWACGWTRPQLKDSPRFRWLLTGKLTSLVTHATGRWVSSESSIELVFQPELRLPMDETMTEVFSVNEEEIERRHRPGRKVLKLLNSEIKFFHTPSDDSLWVTARTSDKLPHPYAENWVGEPLRVLLGQLVFPRLVARNFGNGTAQVWLRPSPPRFLHSGMASLLREEPVLSGQRFWDLYANLLTLVAEARDPQGQRNFEVHKITRFYEEMIQATQGSRWVLCMTLASTAEAIARMLMRPDERKSDFDETEIESLKELLRTWKGDEHLKTRVLGDVARAGMRTIGRYLKDLVGQNILVPQNERSWSAVRNAVMHGNLVSPWATEEEDARLLSLSDLVHRLTHQLIGVTLRAD